MNIDPNQLRQAARNLSIPSPNEQTIRAILAVEGMMLMRQLEEAEKGAPRAGVYIRGVLLACHESTLERLKRGRMSTPSVATMVAIGKSEGPDFGLRVKDWDAAGFPDGDDARYIRLTLARHLEAERNATPDAQGHAAQQPGRDPRPVAVSVPNALNYRPNRGVPGPAPAPPAAPQAAPSPASARRESASPADNLDSRPAPPDVDDAQAPWQQQQRQNYNQDRTRHRAPQQREQRQPQHQQQRRQAEERDATPQAEAGADAEQSGDQTYLSQHIYGGKAAACFSADITRGKVHTVRLEAAESSAARQYDWQRKIAIQLSQRELPLVLAVFMQWLPKFEGKGHGENNSKWFTLENQGNKLYLSVNAKGQSPRGIPIMPGDGYAVTTLLIRQMLKNDPFLTPEIVLSLVRKEAALLAGQPQQGQYQQQQRAA